MKTLKEIMLEMVLTEKDLESQVNGRYHPKAIKKFGKYTLEMTVAGLVVSDGWQTDWITVYNDGTWGNDGTFALTKSIRDYLDKNASKLQKQNDDYKKELKSKKSVKEAKSKKIKLSDISSDVVHEYMHKGAEIIVDDEDFRGVGSNLEGFARIKSLEEDGVYVERYNKLISYNDVNIYVAEDDEEDEIQPVSNFIKKSVKEAIVSEKLQEWDTVKIGTYWLSALYNGDDSGLSEEEIELLDAWERKLPKPYTLDIIDDDPEFGVDVVSGLRGDVVRVRIMVDGLK